MQRIGVWRLELGVLFLLSLFHPHPVTGADSAFPTPHLSLPAKTAFTHDTGAAHGSLWRLRTARDKPGNALLHLQEPLLLAPGTYRFTFVTRRGHRNKNRHFKAATPVFRLELWDHTTHELINQRTLHWDDYGAAHQNTAHWMEMSVWNRQGHFIEPKIFWHGLVDADIVSIDIGRFAEVSLAALENKAHRLGERLAEHHLENGFVVARRDDGDPDEIGDALTYTGFYTAALAWQARATQDPVIVERLEKSLKTLQSAIKGSQEQPVLVRFVDAEGQPHPKSPSKDVYTSFFFAYAIADPIVNNAALKTQMRHDALRLISELWSHDWSVKAGPLELMSISPYVTTDQLRAGIRKLLHDKNRSRKLIKAIEKARRLAPWGGLWKGDKEVIKAIRKKDEKKLMAMTIPTLNSLLVLAERTLTLLREQYRDDLFLRARLNPHLPGKKLEIWLSKRLQLVKEQSGEPVRALSDVRVLGGNALLALHMLRAATQMTQNPFLITLEKKESRSSDSLLETAQHWFNIEEDLYTLTAGNPTANRERRGYLSLLALAHLIQTDNDLERKKTYLDILERWWAFNQNEDNPLAHAIVYVCSEGKWGDVGLILKALDLFPEDTRGHGDEFWHKNAKYIAEQAGGIDNEFSREPLPVNLRPKDSFLWQRTPRRLRGDHPLTYPGTEYLFVYWYCRAHGVFIVKQQNDLIPF